MSFNGAGIWLEVGGGRILMQWRPWQEKFAWLPTDVGIEFVWLKKYYERRSARWPDLYYERVMTLFDVLKNG